MENLAIDQSVTLPVDSFSIQNQKIKFSDGEMFNPTEFFSREGYNRLLNRIHDGSLIQADKKILKQIAFSCARDGLSFISQKKLAAATGYCVDYVGRRLRLLVKRGFLECIEAPLSDRRCFKHSNAYYFVWKSIYNKAMVKHVRPERERKLLVKKSSEKSSEKSCCKSSKKSCYKSEEILHMNDCDNSLKKEEKTHALNTHVPARVSFSATNIQKNNNYKKVGVCLSKSKLKVLQPEIEQLCLELEKQEDTADFNPRKFSWFFLKKGCHPKAVVEALNSLICKHEKPIQSYWAYAKKIVLTKNHIHRKIEIKIKNERKARCLANQKLFDNMKKAETESYDPSGVHLSQKINEICEKTSKLTKEKFNSWNFARLKIGLNKASEEAVLKVLERISNTWDSICQDNVWAVANRYLAILSPISSKVTCLKGVVDGC